MGFLDNVLKGKSSRDAQLDQKDAFAAILLVAIAEDGHISNEEREGFIAVSNRMQLFKDQSISEFNRMTDKLFSLLRNQGSTFLLSKAVETLPVKLRETAFATATDLVFADGRIEEEERAILENLISSLHIDPDLALKIVEVIAIKNRG